MKDDCPHCGRCKHCGRNDYIPYGIYWPPVHVYPQAWPYVPQVTYYELPDNFIVTTTTTVPEVK